MTTTQIRNEQTGLAKVLKKQGRKRSWVGEQLDPPVKHYVISRWCSGAWPIPPDRIPQLAALLNVDEEAIRG